MKKITKVLAMAMAAVLLLPVFAGCDNDNANKNGGNDSGKEKLVIATNAEFPPFEFVVEKDKGIIGEYDGIDIVLMKEIADKLGMELEVSNMTFESIIGAVSSGKADLAVAGMTVDAERLESLDFTDTYWAAIQTILVGKDNTDITNVESLSGKTVGVVTGYTGDTTLSEIASEKNITLKRYNKGIDAVQELINGKLDAAVIDSPTAESFIKENPEIKGVTDDKFFETEEYAIGVKKGNKELLDKVNTALKEIKEAGRIEEIAKEVDARLK
jgi:ABC-type amino acid transport substrate-binding protein